MAEPAHDPAGPAPTVVPQTWAGAIRALAFTPDGRELIAQTTTGIHAFDLERGLMRARLVEGGGEGSIAVSNTAVYRIGPHGLEVLDRTTGKRIPTQLGDRADLRTILGRTPAGELIVEALGGFEIYAESPVRKLRERERAYASTAISSDGRTIAMLETDPAGKFLLGSPLHLWRTADLQPQGSVRCAPDAPRQVAVAAGGSWIACATTRDSIVVTRAGGGSVVVRPELYGAVTVNAMTFHPTKPLLALATTAGGYIVDVTKPGSRVRLEDGRLASTAARGWGYAIAAWSADGSQLAMSDGGAIDVFTPSGQLLRTFTDRVAKLTRISRGRPGVLVIREGDHLRTWDAATGHERPFDGGVLQYAFAATPDGTTRAVFEFADRGTRAAPSGPPTVDVTSPAGRSALPAGHVTALALSPDGRRVYTASSENLHAAQLAGLDVATGKQLWALPVGGDTVQLASARSGDVALLVRTGVANQVDDDLRVVVVTADGQPVGTYRAPGARGAPAGQQAGSTVVTDVAALDGRRWVLAEDKLLTTWDPRTKTIARSKIAAEALAVSLDGARVLATSEHALAVVDARTVAEVASASEPAASMKHGVWLSDRLIATLLGDGTVALWVLHDARLERAGRLVALPRRGTVLVSSPGYYMADAEAASALGFALGPDVFRFEQFDGALDRPHLALGALGVATKDTLALYEAAYAKRRHGQLDASAARMPAPAIELAAPLPVHAAADKLVVKLRADGHGEAIARVNIRVNGVPALGRDGLDVRAKRETRLELAHEVALEIGENRIELEAETAQGVLALGPTSIVTRDGVAKPGMVHVIAIGVSKYKEGNDLQYAAKDADDVAAVIEKYAGSAWAVTKTVLRDDQVTRASVLALRKQLEQTAIDDTVIVFLAGHGLLDADDQYVFGTHDIHFETGAGGIRFAELEGLLDGIPARRRLLLLDTCHAGELDVEELAHIERSERAGKRGIRRVKLTRPRPPSSVDPRARAVAARALFTVLGRGSGVTVVAASAGAEYSVEDPAVKNGLFSHALIDGLESGRADLDKDGAIRVSELLDHLTVEVARQSEGFQVPQARQLNRDLDFDLTPGRPRSTPWLSADCGSRHDGASVEYDCGAVLATSMPATPGLAVAAQLDQLSRGLPPRLTNLKLAWTARHGLALKTARKLVATAPGYKLDVHVGWIAVDMATRRVATCIAVEAIPQAIERCKRALPLLLQATPPQELPE